MKNLAYCDLIKIININGIPLTKIKYMQDYDKPFIKIPEVFVANFP
jgi:hypothetical protein